MSDRASDRVDDRASDHASDRPSDPAGVLPTGNGSERRDRVVARMLQGQASIVAALEALDGEARFAPHAWERPGDTDADGTPIKGGGGRAMVLEGGPVLEKAGVNVSAVLGHPVPPSLAAQHPGTEGKPYFATGVSMVFHPRNPYVPAFHANYRYFEVGFGEESGVWWFGGGADMTPSYPYAEDVRAFHRALAAQCARHAQADYAQMKATCDDYFTVRHRGEMRGVSGIFFDELSAPGAGDFEADFAFVDDGINTLMPSWIPIAERHKGTPWGAREKAWQKIRRGRYAEFNLVYDRGTKFGLQTGGNIEAILMSMPPEASWAFDHRPEPGTPEADALPFFQPRDWVGDGEADG